VESAKRNEEMGMTEKSKTAIRYLKAAQDAILIYDDRSTISSLLAEIYGAAAYGEGDVMEIAGRLVNVVEQAKRDQ
jgi:predicted metal-dependent hydrolase